MHRRGLYRTGSTIQRNYRVRESNRDTYWSKKWDPDLSITRRLLLKLSQELWILVLQVTQSYPVVACRWDEHLTW